jgi:PAS domain S-box-containing protein
MVTTMPGVLTTIASILRPDALRLRREALMLAFDAAAVSWQRLRTPRYGFAAFLVLLAAVIADRLPASNVPSLMVFFSAILLIAIVAGPGPGLLATVLAAACSVWFVNTTQPPFDGPGQAHLLAILLFVCSAAAASIACGVVQRSRARRQITAEHALLDSHDRSTALLGALQDHAVFMLDPDGLVLDWNSGAQHLEGWSEREIVGRHFSIFFPHAATAAGEPARQLQTAAAQGRFHEQAERVRKDGTRFWADVTVTSIRDEHGKPRCFATVIHDVSERVRANRERADNQLRLTGIVDSAMDAIITVDSHQRIVLFNKAAEAMFRCSAAEAMNETLARFLPQRFRQAHGGYITEFAATGATSRSMGRLDTLSALRTNGVEFPIEASISQARVEGSGLFTVIIRDITERRRAEERQSLLLLELAHRVKNTLVIVQSIVAQTRRFTAPEDFQETLNGRLVALGAAHDLLTGSQWAGVTLADVLRFSFAPYDPAQRCTMHGPSIWLASNEAVTFSLVFHELATNAAKYGALSVPDGSVAVRWWLEPDTEPTALLLEWVESGGPVVVPPSRSGFGSRLLRQALAHELGGEANLEFSPLGVQCRLRLPLSQKVSVQ